MEQKQPIISLTGFHLKYIALISMTIDHIGAVLLTPGSAAYAIARAYGRIAFPIFCFLLVEGFFHTSNHNAYLKRLFCFALISEIPFDMAFYHFPAERQPRILFCHQNIFFTLALGFLAMYFIERFRSRVPTLCPVIAIAAVLASQLLRFDYGALGIMVILLFYACRQFYSWMPKPFAYTFALTPLLVSGSWERLFILIPIPLFLFYNGQRGHAVPGRRAFPGEKYFFYWYYPCHLLLLSCIRLV